jgi:glycosyltransferase involved in cell wall biosynthesis
MCTYNGADFLPSQLQSIMAQTRPPDELVVCDDGSSDDTRIVLEQFAGESPFPVLLHFNERNLGSIKNFEKAIGLCRGDLIALSDQDDVWRTDKLQLLEEPFTRSPRVGLVFSDAEVVDENLEPLDRRMWDEVNFDARKRKLVRAGRALEVFITGWTVTGATMAFRSKFAKLALPIPEDIAMIHDGWIALTVASVADIVIIEQPLINYRQHARQQIGAPGRVVRTQTGGRSRELETAFRRRNQSAGLHRILAALEERLTNQQHTYDSRTALSFIGKYSFHLKVRANLPQRRLRRLPSILRELVTLRYHEYANGFKSAAKDLVS